MAVKRIKKAVAENIVSPVEGSASRRDALRIQQLENELAQLREQLRATAAEKDYAIEDAVKKVEESEHRFYNMVYSSPFMIAILEGDELIIKNANDAILATWRKGKEIIGMPLMQAIPDSLERGSYQNIERVYKTGEPFYGYELPIQMMVDGKTETRYYTFLYQAQKNIKGHIQGVAILASEVTPQALLGKKVKESEEQFSTLADNMENLAWLADGTGDIYWYNKRWLDYTGLTLEEMKGWGWQKVQHPDYAAQIPELLEKLWLTNKSFELTFPLRRYDGEYRWFLTRGYPQINENGKISRWIGTSTDIDEQKKAEDRFRQLSDQAPMWVWMADAQMNILYANTELLKFIGIKHYTDFTGYVWEQKVHPNELPKIYSVFNESSLQQKSFSLECRILNAVTNNYEWFFIKGVPHYQAGAFTGFIGTAINIQEQKNTLSQLEYRKALLEAHNEASLDGILLVDTKGKILSYNHRFVEIWNMPQQIADDKDDEAALSFALTQLTNPDQFIEKVKWLYQHPDKISIDELLFKDGKIIERHGYPVTAADGSYYAWSWMFRDITAQRNSEFAVKESEKRLRKTTEHFEIATTGAEVGIWSLDVLTQKLEWSGLHKKMWGYAGDSEELVYEDWHKVILAGDKELAFAEVAKALETRQRYEAVYRIKKQNTGEIRWMRSTGQYFFNDNGEAVTLTGITIDITRQKNSEYILKESEKRFRLLADNMPQLVWTGDTSGYIGYYNKWVLDYTGRSLESLAGEGWMQVVHPDEREENIKLWAQSITTGSDFLFEHRLRRYDGEYRWHLSRAIPQKNNDNVITLWVGASTDIQNLKEEEQRKSDFIKMVSHELKTPVTSIKGYIQMLMSMLNDADKTNTDEIPVKSSLTRIDEQIKRLTRLITEMLDLSKLEESKLHLKKEKILLNDLVKETIQDIEFTNKTHKINIDERTSGWVHADKDRIQQVIINLVNNGIKYSPQKQNIDIEILQPSPGTIGVSIKDFGIGISGPEQEKIFDRFYRVDGKLEFTFAGFGIGLYIAKEILAKHDGTIKVSSQPGVGSVFTFTLPLMQQ